MRVIAISDLHRGQSLNLAALRGFMTLDLGGRVIVNSGDLRDSWSYVIAEDGKKSLHFWR